MGYKYEYPLDNKDEYSARIIFKVIKKDTESTTDAISTLLDQATAGLKVPDASASNEEAQANFEDKKNAKSTALDQSRDHVKKLTSLYGKIEPTKASDESSLKTLSQVSLYLPNGIQINDGAELRHRISIRNDRRCGRTSDE